LRIGLRIRPISRHSTSSTFPPPALSRRFRGPNQLVGCGTMWALEVRPVATRPAFAGDWRRDHRDLRRVYRDGVGSSSRHSRPASLPLRVSRCSPRRAVASDSALRAVRSYRSGITASPLQDCPAVPDFLSWGCQRYSTWLLVSPRGGGPLPVRAGSRVASLVASPAPLRAPVSRSSKSKSDCRTWSGSPPSA